MTVLAERSRRPERPTPDAGWGRLQPAGGLRWVDLLEEDAPDGIRVLHALLDAGCWRPGRTCGATSG